MAVAAAMTARPAVSAPGASPGTKRARPGTLVSMPSKSDASPFSFNPGIALSTSMYPALDGPGSDSSCAMPCVL